ncbi:hypothetical protein J3458_000233 [Metarhizium acridum]|uniref:uncharacterized protein n=1 Tax=Metarhizium acridum TaxID=92637 RepID=UPI001C6AA270|nr:hypothetical protein J3458_000233 [Metarhizium acridum]
MCRMMCLTMEKVRYGSCMWVGGAAAMQQCGDAESFGSWAPRSIGHCGQCACEELQWEGAASGLRREVMVKGCQTMMMIDESGLRHLRIPPAASNVAPGTASTRALAPVSCQSITGDVKLWLFSGRNVN